MFSKRKEKALAKIRANWGKEKEDYINMALASLYFDYKPNQGDFQVLDDRIANDLDLNQIFQKIDRTCSKIGQQYLYDKLRRLSNDEDQLRKFEAQVEHFQEATAEREAAQVILSLLDESNDYYYPILIFGESPPKPSWLPWAHFLQGISIATLLFSIFYPPSFIIFAFVLPINIFLHYQNKNRIGKFTNIFNRFNSLLGIGQQIMPFILEEEGQAAKQHFQNLKNVARDIGWIKLDRLKEQEALAPLWFLIEILKFITLSELIGFYRTLRKLKKYRSSIQYVFDLIGKLDASISVASFRTGLPYYQSPEFLAPNKQLNIAAALHPILVDGIPNDISLNEKSMLLTGSNMSGKTTYIRTIGINAILAQTILTPICKAYQAPFLKLGTSIRIQDDVEEEKSYYLEEVTVIGDLIKSSQETQPYLFIIDELFKGTNTLERVCSAKAVLSYLNQNNNIVLISTHDIKLTDYLANEFDLYYFQEQVEASNLVFDYKLKRGKLQQKNAIKILALMDYPSAIVDEANQLAGEFK